MGGVNVWHGIGNLGADPELRFVGDSKTAVCDFRMACNETWKDAKGEKQERVEWIAVVCWRGLAENCASYLKKGRPVYVSGRLQTRKWQDKEGNDRYTTEVVARDVTFLGSRGDGAPAQDHGQPAHVEAAGNSEVPF